MSSSSESSSSSSISSFFDSDSNSKLSIKDEDSKKEHKNTDALKEISQKLSSRNNSLKEETDNNEAQSHERFPNSITTHSKDSDSSSTSSSSSELLSTSRNVDVNFDDLKPALVASSSPQVSSTQPVVEVSASEKRDKPLSVSVDKAIQFPSRPRTAKPGKYRTRRERIINNPPSTTSSADTTEEEKRKGKTRGKRRVLSSTSSYSSVTTFDDASQNVADQNSSARLANYHNVKARELLLHRYLDRHLAKQLDDQKSYFETRSPRGLPTKPGKRKTMSSSSSGKRGDRKMKGRSPYGSSTAILTAYTPKSRESDVKRNIRLLVAELAKYQSLNEKSSQIIERRKPTAVNQKPPRPQSSRKMEFKEESSSESLNYDSDKSRSDKSSGSSQREDRYLHPGGNGSRHIKVVIPSDTGSEDVEKQKSDEERKQHSKKSISKSKNLSRSAPLKHVLMAEQLEMEEIQSRKRLDKRQRNSHPTLLLTSLGNSDYLMADNHGVFHRVSLSPAPIQSRLSPRSPWTAPPRPKRKQASSAKKEKSKPGRKLKRGKKEGIEKEEKKLTNKNVKLEKSEKENVETLPHTPRIQPGNEPIKCNWDPNKSSLGKKEPKFSDHQLKNSDNPAVLEWLAHKNAMAQRNRIYRFKEHRTKRNILMQEQNAKEDKKENALIEYERWKKKKNREILLRRRNETLEATGDQSELGLAQTALSSSLCPNNKTKDTTITAFSDLRSHAIIPQPPVEPLKSGLSKHGGRARPKSAPTKVSFGTPVATHAKKAETFVPVKIDFGNGDVTLMKQERSDVTNLSAREPIMQNGDKTSSSFIEDLLDAESAPKSMFAISPSGISPKTKVETGVAKSTNRGENTTKAKVLDRNHYDNWMKSNGTSSPYQIKLDRKKKKRDASTQPLPEHDPMTNDLLSDLAKRRIQKIMDQKKRVDSGLKKKTRESEAQNPPNKNQSKPGNSVKRWRLREDLAEDQLKQNAANPDKNSDKVSLRNGRPMFSYKKKKSKSIFEKQATSTK